MRLAKQARFMRGPLMAAGAAGLLLAAGGCATASSGSPSAAPAPSPSAAPSASSPTGASGEAASAAGASATGTSPAKTSANPTTTTAGAHPAATRTATSSAIKDCLTRNLKITDIADEGGGAAGHHTEFLVFRNETDFACTLDGFPGVSFVAGDDGRQVGSPFLRTDSPRHPLTLNPGDSVHATILIADYRNVDPAACKPTKVRGYRVYPPNETAAAFVPHPQTACAAPDEAAGQVQPVEPGPGSV
ncbi:hypothetical protein ACTI_59310 [Actinoplanes sp. OR16]|uniref:DUF4232 domain-containing protein n=1 Tax=Actinoplanes sp. OR16 TaxID=946334 RepID=UPI000F6D4CFC|nr:DUF4232 domain-containing protein [Actinoplanes sp. OR16]BBH69246.1 hypothetical protein ACTI_59310 [Actinoplanes sp. OR16]